MRIAQLLTVCMLIASPVRAQEDAVRTIPFDGVEVFSHILHHTGLAPMRSIDALAGAPRETLLIVFGDPRILDHVGLKAFLKDGGNALVCTDRNLKIRELSVRVSGEQVRVGPKHSYRGNTSCPMFSLERTSAPSSWNAHIEHPIFRFLHKGIATNCPSLVGVEVDNSPFHPLLGRVSILPTDPDFQKTQVRGWSYILGSPGSAKPAGRALFIAGHGLFMNGMMMQTDNDNFDFAINVVRWLREGPNRTTRTKALFVVNGKVMTNFDAKLTPPPTVPMPPIKAVDRLLHGLEKERFFHGIVDRLIGDNRNTMLSILFAAVTFLLILYGAKKLMEGRFLLDTAVPRMVGTATLGPTVSAVEQRQGGLFRQANLAGEARLLAQTWLRQEFGIEPGHWNPGTRMGLQVNGWFWDRTSLQRQADRVLHLACAVDAAPMTRREFARLLRTLQQLSGARRGGRLALLEDAKTV